MKLKDDYRSMKSKKSKRQTTKTGRKKCQKAKAGGQNSATKLEINKWLK